MNFTEENFKAWTKRLSDTEADTCANAENMVRKAIAASDALSELNTSVFAQGSYRANTNVRQNSDVDICIRYNGAFFPRYPKEMTGESLNHSDSKLSFSDYKAFVEDALLSYFGADGYTRGDKAFEIHGNSYRIGTDLVPTFEYRHYTGRENADGSDHYLSGVAFRTDRAVLIENWPQQTYDKGVTRNNDTGRRYKRTIRIVKRLRDKMLEEEYSTAESVPSYLIECLLWNANMSVFSEETYTETIRAFIVDIWNRTKPDRDCSKWCEVNGIKRLFGSHQPWEQEQVHAFLKDLWNYVGYKSK